MNKASSFLDKHINECNDINQFVSVFKISVFFCYSFIWEQPWNMLVTYANEALTGVQYAFANDFRLTKTQ